MTDTASWASGEQRSSVDNLVPAGVPGSQLIINSVATDEGVNDALSLLHASDTGMAGVSYLTFGLPGTPTYSLWDLNNLPSNTSVALRIFRAGRTLSNTVFNAEGLQGDVPEPSSPNASREVPDWAFALAKTIAFGDDLDRNVQYPSSVYEILKLTPGFAAPESESQSTPQSQPQSGDPHGNLDEGDEPDGDTPEPEAQHETPQAEPEGAGDGSSNPAPGGASKGSGLRRGPRDSVGSEEEQLPF